MNFLKMFFLFLLFIILSGSSNIDEVKENHSNQDGWKENYESVFKLTLITKNKTSNKIRASFATGFSIYSENNDKELYSLILTNDHFCEGIEDNSFLSLEDVHYNTVNVFFGISIYEVVKTDPTYDLCVLKVPGFLKPISILDETSKVNMTDDIMTIGAPGGRFPIILKGIISGSLPLSYNDLPMYSIKNNFLIVSLKIERGQSGSPIMTMDGKVAGILFAAYPEYGGLVISHLDIRTFLLSNGINFN